MVLYQGKLQKILFSSWKFCYLVNLVSEKWIQQLILIISVFISITKKTSQQWHQILYDEIAVAQKYYVRQLSGSPSFRYLYVLSYWWLEKDILNQTRLQQENGLQSSICSAFHYKWIFQSVDVYFYFCLFQLSIRQPNEINCMQPKVDFFQLTAVNRKVGIRLINCTKPTRSWFHR